MKTIILAYFTLLVFGETFAQSTIGITHKPDTSYSNYSAYNGTKKTYPDIKLVNEFKLATVSEKRNINYCSIGETKLLLDVFYPAKKDKKPLIAIVIIHGGGWRSGNRTQHYPLAQRLADLGYVCITPGYRLSTEALYPAAVYDLKSAIRWIKQNAKEFNIDTSKITALGFSAGGELAAFLGTTGHIKEFEGMECNRNYTGKVQAVVDIDGTLSFFHPESGEGDDSKRISAATYWFGYSKKDNPELWKQASPLTYVGENTTPTLFLNSAVERMHAGRNDYTRITDEHNIYTEVKTFEGSPHAFCLFDPWFEPTVKHVDEFLKKVFKP